MFTFSLRNVPISLINSMANLPSECLGVMSKLPHSFLLLPLGKSFPGFLALRWGTQRSRIFHSPKGRGHGTEGGKALQLQQALCLSPREAQVLL